MFVFGHLVSHSGRGCQKMSRCNQEIVCEGWLTKSPPNKRIWRAKWRRRWFVLRHSGELPGQYYLDYYADRNCRKVKGSVDLDLCEQVDAGLCMETGNGASNNPMFRGSVFSLQTNTRTYHLVADSVSEMENWVDAICRVCGLRVADDDSFYSSKGNGSTDVADVNNVTSSGPYIPISECITGLPVKQQPTSPRTFTFDTDALTCDSLRANSVDMVSNGYHGVHSEPARHEESAGNSTANSGNRPDYPIMEKFCFSRNPKPRPTNCSAEVDIQSNVVRSFKGLSVNSKPVSPNESYINTIPVSSSVPPRPPKPSHLMMDASETAVQKDPYVGPPMCEPVELLTPFIGPKDSNSYHNLPAVPPAVDRTLKPGRNSRVNQNDNELPNDPRFNVYGNSEYHAAHSTIGRITTRGNGQKGFKNPNSLQYLDLDLDSISKPPRSDGVHHGKSRSALETKTVYNTVDFFKTEALIMTRQDAEAARSRLPPK